MTAEVPAELAAYAAQGLGDSFAALRTVQAAVDDRRDDLRECRAQVASQSCRHSLPMTFMGTPSHRAGALRCCRQHSQNFSTTAPCCNRKTQPGLTMTPARQRQ